MSTFARKVQRRHSPSTRARRITGVSSIGDKHHFRLSNGEQLVVKSDDLGLDDLMRKYFDGSPVDGSV